MSEHSTAHSKLLIRPAHVMNESLRGYLSRLSCRNGSSPLLTPMLDSLQAATEAIPEIAMLSDCSDHILYEHGSYLKKTVAGGPGVVFGSSFLSTKQVRLDHRMVCPVCLSKKEGVSVCCWELRDYDVCHLHGRYLVGNCNCCNRPLTWTTTSSEACSCGARLASLPTQPAPNNRRLLCSLIANAVEKAVTRSANKVFIPEALTPLNWFYIFRNFLRSILIPGFYSEHIGYELPLSSGIFEDLLIAILNDQEYCRHLRQVIFLHAANNPMTLAQALKSDNTDEEMVTFFMPCFKDVVIHDRLIAVKLNQRKWGGVLSPRFAKPGFVAKKHRPESHSFQLQATAFLSAISAAYSYRS